MGLDLFSEKPGGPVLTLETAPDDDWVTSPAQIEELLQRLIKTHSIISVAVRGVDDTFSSALIELVPELGYLVMDELNPKAGHELLSPGKRIHVATRIGALGVRFSSLIAEINADDNPPYYKVPYPTMVDYDQRREFFRAPVPIETEVSIQLLTEMGSVLAGEIRDISVGGVSIRLNPGYTRVPAVGDLIATAIMDLPRIGQVTVAMEICYAGALVGHKRPRLGGRFIAPEKTAERAIAQFVALMDRQVKRQLARI